MASRAGRKTERVAALTPRQKLTVAYLYEIREIAQHDLAVAFDVNQGRINEAILPIRRAAGFPDRHPEDAGGD